MTENATSTSSILQPTVVLPTTHHAARPVGLLRRVALVITLLLAALTAVGTFSAPAQAASGVSYCFVYSNGAPYANQPVFLKIRTTAGWKQIASSTSGMNGCGGFTMTGAYRGYQSRVLAYQQLVYGGQVKTVWSGWTPRIANPGNAAPSIGTGIVSCTPITMAC